MKAAELPAIYHGSAGRNQSDKYTAIKSIHEGIATNFHVLAAGEEMGVDELVELITQAKANKKYRSRLLSSSVAHVVKYLIPDDPSIEDVRGILSEAYDQTANGKGRERHETEGGIEEQPAMEISRRVGIGFLLGQAIKKLMEQARLPPEMARNEILGAMNYLTFAIIMDQECTIQCYVAQDVN